MTYSNLAPARLPQPLVGQLLRLAFVALAMFACFARAADTGKRPFDVPASDAVVALKQFAAQAGRDILYLPESVRGTTMNAIKGELTPREALDRMVAGTALTVSESKGGILAVKRVDDPNGQRAAPLVRRDRPEPTADPEAETILLSPFTVSSEKDAGYYGANSMSGTRMNSKLEDLGSSISVVTKQQMTDLALLNMDDIFSYEAGTEGSADFTDFSFDRNGSPVDNTQLNPLSANRIRGVGAANVTFGNFETSGRTPIDSLEVDAVEIGRGPNSNIFGIGNAAGTVNTVRASANLARNRAQVSARVDSEEGYRTTLDVNRVLKPGKLAVRGTAVAQRDGFQQKPSGVLTERFSGMVRFQPFKGTSINGSYAYFHSYGNRPNSITPREAITAWRAAGSPVWDPITATAKVNGVTSTVLPSSLTTQSFATASLAMVTPEGWTYWGPARSSLATASASPATRNGPYYFVAPSADPLGFRTSQPLINDYPPLTSKEIYDWSSLNLAAPNRTDDKSEISSVIIDQALFSTARQHAFVQLGWFREATERFRRNLVGFQPLGTLVSAIQVDVNERLLDGRPNPNFLRPFINAANPDTNLNPLDRDTYRAQLAYRIDFAREKSRLRWLGRHELGVYYEYKNYQAWNRNHKDAIVSDHSWLSNATRATGNAQSGLPAGSLMSMSNYFFYLGDHDGQNIEYGAPGYTPGTYPYTWGLNSAGQIVTEPARLERAYQSSNNSWTILKSRGAILQSHLLNGRIVTTLGIRHDARYSRSGAVPLLNPDGYTLDEASYLRWSASDWNVGKGLTRTAGIVAKPLSWFSVFANKSESFQPAAAATDLYRRPLPDPTGQGEDYGFMLRLFDGKLMIRANQYSTKQVDSRAGTVGTLGSRILVVDRPGVPGQLATTPAYQLQPLATNWVRAAAAAEGKTLTQAEITTQVAAIMGVPESFFAPFQTPTATTSDLIAKGREVEVYYNPTRFWTLKANVTQKESIQANIGTDVARWYAERMKVWPTIIDPTTGRPWFTERYNNATSAAQNTTAQITTPLGLALATEGLSNPQIRKYRVNATTNLQLAGITDHPVVKRFNVGGAARWEDAGAIGYYGKQTLPAIMTEYDPTRPIYDRAHLYLDAFAGYRTRLFGNKVGTTIQLNVRNLLEGGRLQPIAADADGSIAAFRIVNRRLFILTTTFDF